MGKQWIITKKDHQFGGGENPVAVTAGTLGLIHEVTDDGKLYVCFPQAHNYFKIQDLLPAPEMTVEEAIGILRSYHGHHCRNDDQVQFNIKIYAFPPDYVRDIDDDAMWEHYNHLLESELHAFMGVDCDYGLLQLFDDIDNWQTAGRSGGWLVIKFHDDFEVLYGDYEYAKERVEKGEIQFEQDMKDFASELINMARVVQYIAQDIEHAKKQVEKFIESREAWDEWLADHGVEEEEADEMFVAMETNITNLATSFNRHVVAKPEDAHNASIHVPQTSADGAFQKMKQAIHLMKTLTPKEGEMM